MLSPADFFEEIQAWFTRFVFHEVMKYGASEAISREERVFTALKISLNDDFVDLMNAKLLEQFMYDSCEIENYIKLLEYAEVIYAIYFSFVKKITEWKMHWLAYLEKPDNKPLSKLASVRKVEGGSEHRSGVYTSVYEDLSTEPMHKFSTEVEFQNRFNGDTESLAEHLHHFRENTLLFLPTTSPQPNADENTHFIWEVLESFRVIVVDILDSVEKGVLAHEEQEGKWVTLQKIEEIDVSLNQALQRNLDLQRRHSLQLVENLTRELITARAALGDAEQMDTSPFFEGKSEEAKAACEQNLLNKLHAAYESTMIDLKPLADNPLFVCSNLLVFYEKQLYALHQISEACCEATYLDKQTYQERCDVYCINFKIEEEWLKKIARAYFYELRFHYLKDDVGQQITPLQLKNICQRITQELVERYEKMLTLGKISSKTVARRVADYQAYCTKVWRRIHFATSAETVRPSDHLHYWTLLTKAIGYWVLLYKERVELFTSFKTTLANARFSEAKAKKENYLAFLLNYSSSFSEDAYPLFSPFAEVNTASSLPELIFVATMHFAQQKVSQEELVRWMQWVVEQTAAGAPDSFLSQARAAWLWLLSQQALPKLVTETLVDDTSRSLISYIVDIKNEVLLSYLVVQLANASFRNSQLYKHMESVLMAGERLVPRLVELWINLKGVFFQGIPSLFANLLSIKVAYNELCAPFNVSRELRIPAHRTSLAREREETQRILGEKLEELRLKSENVDTTALDTSRFRAHLTIPGTLLSTSRVVEDCEDEKKNKEGEEESPPAQKQLSQ